MRRVRIPWTVTVCCLAVVWLASSTSADEPKLLDGKELVQELQKGGYVLYFRHPNTDPTQADTDTLNLDNIKAQRHLTDKGRAQAKAIGEAFRALKIPVGSIMSSKFYRATEAAKLMDFGEVKTSLDLTEPQNVPPIEGRRRAAELKKILAAAPPAGKNIMIIGHKPCLQDAAGKEFGDLAEGEAAIFQPLGDKGHRLVARVAVDAWSKWAETLKP